MRIFAVLVAALLLSAAADNRQPILIHPGETISIELRGTTAVVLERRPAPPMDAYTAALLPKMQIESERAPTNAGVLPPTPVMPDDVPAEPPKARPHIVQITFRRVPGLRPGSEDHSLLTLLNGYDSAFRYRAVMHGNGRTVQTDVCEIMPGKGGNEHWPYPIEQLDLSDLRLEAWQEGQLRCE
jgi:hypothetical protein